jgi:hypothetical protein
VWDAVVSRLGRKDVVSVQPTAVRSWAAGAAPLDREYVWHQVARAWQTPGLSEKVMAGCLHWWQLERPAELERHWSAV